MRAHYSLSIESFEFSAAIMRMSGTIARLIGRLQSPRQKCITPRGGLTRRFSFVAAVDASAHFGRRMMICRDDAMMPVSMAHDIRRLARPGASFDLS